MCARCRDYWELVASRRFLVPSLSLSVSILSHRNRGDKRRYGWCKVAPIVISKPAFFAGWEISVWLQRDFSPQTAGLEMTGWLSMDFAPTVQEEARRGQLARFSTCGRIAKWSWGCSFASWNVAYGEIRGYRKENSQRPFTQRPGSVGFKTFHPCWNRLQSQAPQPSPVANTAE